mgnify:CR=1 FL=1
MILFYILQDDEVPHTHTHSHSSSSGIAGVGKTLRALLTNSHEDVIALDDEEFEVASSSIFLSHYSLHK